MTPLEAPLAADLRENLLWRGATILVVLIVANLAVSQFVLQRLTGLATAISGFGHGQIYSPLPEDNPDEIGQLARAFNRMTRRLTERESENRMLSESLQSQSTLRGELLKGLITAQEDERKRVARELHDELGQALASLSFQSEAMERFHDYREGDRHNGKSQNCDDQYKSTIASLSSGFDLVKVIVSILIFPYY